MSGRLDVELSGRGARRGAGSRAWPWALTAAVAVAVFGTAGWMLLSERAPVEPVPMAHVAGGSSDMRDQASTAMLVHAGGANGASVAAEDPLSVIRSKAAAGEDERQAVAARGGDASDPADRLAPGARSASTQVGRGRASAETRRAARPRASDEKADLLTTLMSNIREQPAKAGAQNAGPQTLDELVAQLSKAPPQQSAAAGGGVNATDQSSANLQRQLRSCPAANTTSGIRCRQRLCAKHRGDPACPTIQ